MHGDNIMKYIVAFVLLGLAAYAGVFILYTGIRDTLSYKRSPVTLSSITYEDFVDGMALSAKVDRQFGTPGFTNTVRQKFFGTEVGEAAVQHFYLIPAGKITDPTIQRYMLICVTDEEDIEAIENLYSERLYSVGSGAAFECRGVLKEAPPEFIERCVNYIIWKPRLLKDPEYLDMLGDDSLSAPQQVEGYNAMSKYVFYVQHNDGKHALLIIIGSAVTVVSGGLIALVAVKKHRENSGY